MTLAGVTPYSLYGSLNQLAKRILGSQPELRKSRELIKTRLYKVGQWTCEMPVELCITRRTVADHALWHPGSATRLWVEGGSLSRSFRVNLAISLHACTRLRGNARGRSPKFTLAAVRHDAYSRRCALPKLLFLGSVLLIICAYERIKYPTALAFGGGYGLSGTHQATRPAALQGRKNMASVHKAMLFALYPPCAFTSRTPRSRPRQSLSRPYTS